MPTALEALRDRIHKAIDEGNHQTALVDARESLAHSPDAEGHYLLGRALEANSEPAEAEDAYQIAIELEPEHADAHLALADLSILRMDIEAAHQHVCFTLRSDPMHAAALHFRGCLRELQEYDEGAARDFAAAALLDPEYFPIPTPLDDATLDAVVQRVLDSLHPTLQNYLCNVAILVEEMPSPEVMDEVPFAHPFELLGSFSGPSLADSDGLGPVTAWSAIPPTISIYRRNLQRFADGPEQLVAELRVTLLHEIGHFLGLDEDDLAARGLD